MEKRRNCSLGASFPIFHNILLLVVRFLCWEIGTRYSFKDKRLFEISEVDITRVDCIFKYSKMESSLDSDQTPQDAASGPGLCSLQSHKNISKTVRHINQTPLK